MPQTPEEQKAARDADRAKLQQAQRRNVRHPATQRVANRAGQDKGYPERKG